MRYEPASNRFSQRGAPLRASNAETICAPDFGSPDVMNRRFSQITGELWPMFDSGRFQRKLAGSHLVGMSASSLWPAPLGPRKRSQFAAKSVLGTISKVAMLRRKRISRRGAEAQRRGFNHEDTKDTKGVF